MGKKIGLTVSLMVVSCCLKIASLTLEGKYEAEPGELEKEKAGYIGREQGKTMTGIISSHEIQRERGILAVVRSLIIYS